ncbi:MAG: Na+/H+ antiporter subunit E [Ornithinimicrobium sp.]|jgi:multicomponent Na+:H+ antiporter subunit E|uniref:Na+/H+ antiporter subunit E n=1 Tax=Ornithinimicrobium sp. TaxID=1977084 RepID=UPI003D9B9DC0
MIHPLNAVRYFGFITWEVLSGAVTVAVDAFTPGKGATPMIVELPLRCTTDFEVTTMASSITITPGTITVGITPATGPAPATLFVHSMYVAEREDVLEGLHDMERRLLLMTRGKEADR